MTNLMKVCYVLVIHVYIVTVYGWDHFSRIPNYYENRHQYNPNNIFGHKRIPSLQEIFPSEHQPYPSNSIRGDLEYDTRIQQEYIQPILRQIQELLIQIKSLSMSRFEPAYDPLPIQFNPKTENSLFSGDSSINTQNRFPADDDANQNWGLSLDSEYKDPKRNWGIVEEKESNNGTKTECKCDMTRTSPSAQYMNTIDSATRCKAATLFCCIRGYSTQQRKDCFDAQGCIRSYETGYACLPVIIDAVYAQLYGTIRNRL